MRLPALRLPMSVSGRLEGVNGRRLLLYTVYTAVLFAIFLLVNFPYDVIVRRALREASLGPVHLQVAGTRFAWFNGWELSRVRLVRDATEAPVLESPSVYVKPGLNGLWAGKLSSLRVKADIYGGKVRANWVGGRDIDRTSLQLDRIQIGLDPFLNGLLDEGQMAGLIGGAVTVEDHRGDLRAGRAAGEIQLQHASLTGAKVNGIGIPDLHFETVALKFEYEGGKLELQELNADGAELKVGGTGQVVLTSPVENSILNLRITALPGAEAPDDVRGLLSLIPRSKKARPDAPVVIEGTLGKPRFR
jgi:type II secretion system protein N